MADSDKEDKTEDATPRKRQEARDEGNVAMSTELIAAGMLVGIAISALMGGQVLAEATAGQVRSSFESFGHLGRLDLALADTASILRDSIGRMLTPLAAVMLPVVLLGAALGYFQVGFHVAYKAVRINPGKLNPMSGFSKLFNMKNTMKTFLAALKILMVVLAMGFVAWSEVPTLAGLAGMDIQLVMKGAGTVILKAVAAGVLVILLLSIIDLYYQRYQHDKDLRMTKKEVKDEHKNSEGDPHVKARIRKVQRELATQRMMEDVPDATVVVTNPTHFAVALRYDRTIENASPVVVAKGVDAVALRIREVARTAGVPQYEDRLLARALHAQVEIGDAIPEELFQAVAKVLAYVYRLQGETVSNA